MGQREGELKIRLDLLLVERGLAESREQAQRFILAGLVDSDCHGPLKPGLRIRRDAPLQVKGGERYVSRGGLKLEAALESFGVCPEGLVCADIGASTGGFTDCLLQHGAARVYAVDVGKSRLHSRLRNDPRVVLVEEANARGLGPASLPEAPMLVVIDVSFISLNLIFGPVGMVADPSAACIALVKPQFEATRAEVSRGKGVVRDAGVHRRVLAGVINAARESGWHSFGLRPSPIAGGSGNREYLLHLRRRGQMEPLCGLDIDGVVELAFKP